MEQTSGIYRIYKCKTGTQWNSNEGYKRIWEQKKTKQSQKKKALKGVGKTDDVAFYLGQHIVQIKTDKNKVLSDF